MRGSVVTVCLAIAACTDVGAPPALGGDASTGEPDASGSSTAGPVGTTGPAPDRDPPGVPVTLRGDRYSASADTALVIAAPEGVLANDDGVALDVVDHDTRTIAGGVLGIDNDGALTYTPPPDFGGCDRATYAVAGAEARAEIVFVVHRGGALASPTLLADIADEREGLGMLAESAAHRAGNAVSIIGDMNGDGRAEIAIAAPEASPRDRTGAGRVYVVGAHESRGLVDLHATATRDGFVIDGDLAGAHVGERLVPAGDVDGDGLADLLIAAPRTNIGGGPQGDHAGRVFVVFGRAHPSALDLQQIFPHDAQRAPSFGQAFTGEYMGDHAGTAIASAGDLDGDGTDDLLIGAPLWGPQEQRPGRVYVVFSRPQAGTWRFDQMLASGHAVAVEGSGNDELGRVVAGVGDLDGDGWRDIAIGAPAWDAARGRVWIVRGPITGGAIATLHDEDRVHVIDGESAGDAFGAAITSIPSGDGAAELAIGAPGWSSARGRTWIASATIAMSAEAAIATDDVIVIDGEAEGDATGTVLSAAGDLDRDGHGDVWIGAGQAEGGAGRTYAVFLARGRNRRAAILLADVMSGTNGFALLGTAVMGTGRAVAGGVDLDGDAIPDAIVGSPGASERGDYSGRADVVSGAAVLCD